VPSVAPAATATDCGPLKSRNGLICGLREENFWNQSNALSVVNPEASTSARGGSVRPPQYHTAALSEVRTAKGTREEMQHEYALLSLDCDGLQVRAELDTGS
jgi:hypothetical protein